MTDLAAMKRFWAKVEKGEGCWEWTGARTRDGYGDLGINRRHMKAHRVAYELLVGPIPGGLELDHLCRNPPCVRPDHLEPVTHAENLRRGMGGPGVNARKTRCIRGHPFDEANTAAQRDGSRRCRECERRRQSNQVVRLVPYAPKRSRATGREIRMEPRT